MVSFFAFCSGIVFGLGTFYLIGLNGLSLGAMFAFTGQHGLAGRLFDFVVAHGCVELSCICIAGAAGAYLGEALIRPGELTRSEAFRAAAADGIRVLAVVTLLLFICGFIEGYVSPDPEVPRWARVTIGVGYWLFMVSLLRGYVFGRSRGGAPIVLDLDRAFGCAAVDRRRARPGRACRRARRAPRCPAARSVATCSCARLLMFARRERDGRIAPLARRTRGEPRDLGGVRRGDDGLVARHERLQRRASARSLRAGSARSVSQTTRPRWRSIRRTWIAATTGFGFAAIALQRLERAGAAASTARKPRSGSARAQHAFGIHQQSDAVLDRRPRARASLAATLA